jgi:transposase
VIADGRGRAIAFALAPGQAHELPLAPRLLGCLPDVPGWIVGDRGFASDAFRECIWNLGARPAIPPKRTDAPVACPEWIYANRHLVENLWARLKEWRAVATRYEKTARSFLGEPPRVSRRLRSLRGWSHGNQENSEELLA